MSTIIHKLTNEGAQFCRGSSGGNNYLVVAEDTKRGARLAVRPMIEPLTIVDNGGGHRVAAAVGFRLRMMPTPDASGWTEAFGPTPWASRDHKRYSAEFGSIFGRPMSEAWQLFYDLEAADFYEKATEWLLQRAPLDMWRCTPGQLSEFLRMSYREALPKAENGPDALQAVFDAAQVSFDEAKAAFDEAKSDLAEAETTLNAAKADLDAPGKPIEAYLTPTQELTPSIGRFKDLVASIHAGDIQPIDIMHGKTPNKNEVYDLVGQASDGAIVAKAKPSFGSLQVVGGDDDD